MFTFTSINLRHLCMCHLSMRTATFPHINLFVGNLIMSDLSRSARIHTICLRTINVIRIVMSIDYKKLYCLRICYKTSDFSINKLENRNTYKAFFINSACSYQFYILINWIKNDWKKVCVISSITDV